MANELRTSYQGDSNTIYAIIRRQSDSYVYNGTTFATWADGSIATYDIPLTARGGDLYSADFPAGIAAENYTISYYLQAGGTPAITDTLITSESKRWNGDTLGSTSTVSLSPYALTTLANLEAFGSVGDIDDTIATQAINAASALIERATGRNFAARDYVHRFNGVRQDGIVLRERPVIHITRCAFGQGTAATLTFSGTAIRATASANDTGLRLQTVTAGGTVTTSTLTWANYATVSLLAAAVNAVSGWSMTTATDRPTTELYPTGGEDANNATVSLYYPDQDANEYAVDYERGIVRFRNWEEWIWRTHDAHHMSGVMRFPRQWQGVTVSYNAGYATIPADVEYLATEIAAQKYHASLIDNATKSAALGPYSVSYGDIDNESTIRTRLAHYIDPMGYIG